jgi:hypothetical protein
VSAARIEAEIDRLAVRLLAKRRGLLVQDWPSYRREMRERLKG